MENQHFPSGYRFCPRDHELVLDYLRKKIRGLPLPCGRIKEIDISKFKPEQLREVLEVNDEDEEDIYFFSRRQRKYSGGSRPTRIAADGYWSAATAEEPIKHKGEVIGYKRQLVFRRGKNRRAVTTKWIMHEYTVERLRHANPTNDATASDMTDLWALCHIYENVQGNNNEEVPALAAASQDQEPSDSIASICSWKLIESSMLEFNALKTQSDNRKALKSESNKSYASLRPAI